jgi:hypothetical protein
VDKIQSNDSEGRTKNGAEHFLGTFWENFKQETKKPKFCLEILAIVGLFAYTTVSCLQYGIARSGTRPFVGPASITLKHIWTDQNGVQQVSEVPTNQATRGGVLLHIKNFGPLPATNFDSEWTGFVGDIQLPTETHESRPSVLFPSQILIMKGGFDENFYKIVMHGEKALRLIIKITYDGPNAPRENICEEYQYKLETNGFYKLKDCK